MEIAKWTVVIALFAFAENAATTGIISPEYLNITKPLNTVTREIFLAYPIVGEMIGFQDKLIQEEFDGKKIKIKSKECHSEIRLLKNSSKILQIEAQSLVSLEVYLPDYNHSFVTETFPFSIVISQFDQIERTSNEKEVTWNNNFVSSITFSNLDSLDVKILASDYKYKSNEEESRIKQQIKTVLTSFYDANFKTFEFKRSLAFLRDLLQTIESTTVESPTIESVSQTWDELYYSIGPVSTSDYIVNNITIKGFGRVESISANASNSVDYLDMKLRGVSGAGVVNYKASNAEPLDLIFGLENVYISKSKDAKFKVRGKGYSFLNKKTKTPLASGSLKDFVENFESVFTNSFAKGSN